MRKNREAVGGAKIRVEGFDMMLFEQFSNKEEEKDCQGNKNMDSFAMMVF